MEETYYELTHPQKRIWFTEEKYEGTSFANLALTVKYREKIDFPLLEKAINIVIKQNEGMRIRLGKTDNQILQYISPFEEYVPPFIDFSGKDEDTFNTWVKNKTLEPFILTDSDLFSFFLIKFNEKEEGYYIKTHHAISDGWTLGMIFQEVEYYYDILKNGTECEVKSYPSYIQFISDERAYLSSPDAERDREFWMNYLSPLPEEVNLSEKKVKATGICAKSLSIKIPAELSEKIYGYCKEYKSSVFKLILSCFAIYITGVTSSEEAVIGSANHNRSTKDQKNMTGMFVSTIPLRIIPDKDMDFNSFVEKTGNDINYIIKNHARYPFDILAGEIRKKYGVRPDYLLNLTLIGHPPMEDARKQVDRIYPDYEPSDMAVHIFEKADDNKKYIELEWDYQTEKFAGEHIERIHTLLCQIISDAISEPHKKISRIKMCPPQEEKIIFEKFNNTFFEIPEDVTVHELFEQQAELHPDKPAVVYEERKLTYGELNRQANQIAAGLRKDGVKPDMPVGILLDSSPEMIVSILGVLKAGGFYVPIDPDYPPERISYMLSDSGAKILLTKKSLFNKFTFDGIIYDLEERNFFRGNRGNPEKVNNPHNLAYIIYTSGTTGRPKGVLIEHHSLVNLSTWYIHTHGITCDDNASKYMAPAFDSSVAEIYPSLLAGATVHIIPKSIRLSPLQLNEYYETHHITTALLPTQFGEQFMELTKNQSLKWLLIAGEKLKSFTPQRYTVYNGYGPTEYTVETSFFTIDKYYENIPIGKPAYNTSVYIVDSCENLQPVGVPGELCISGKGLSRGYLNRKELTEQKFVNNPFKEGTKMYKTGDLARWLPDGNLEFLGRIDRQVKIRGFRIELAEIEQAMKSFDFIEEAVVVDHMDENNRLYLCGYYISDEEIDTERLKRELTKSLPDYMIPRHILKIDKIPLTPHGKVDKKALPVPDKSLLSSGYVAPATDEERFMAQIWKDVLKCGEVGIYDDFFSLGGDSIMSIQAVARAREAGINISAGMLQAYPTIAGLLEHVLISKPLIEEKKEEVISHVTIPLSLRDSDRSSIEAIYGLAPLQEGLLFHAMASPDADLYCTQMCWSYEGELHIEALKEAWSDIFSAHPVFRTGFIWEETAVQIVYREVSLPWYTMDLSERDREKQEEEIEKIRKNIRREGFNLNKPPLVSFYLIRLGNCEYRFIWSYHHIILDGWSIPLILKELYGRYESIVHKETFHFKAPEPFEDYIKWLSVQDKEKTIDYWKNNLSDFSAPTPLTVNHSRPDIHKPVEHMKDYVRNISEDFLAECQEFSRSVRITVNTLLQLAWYSVLACYSGYDDVLSGITVSGRPPELDGVENMIGLFINTVPFRVKLAPSESVVYNLKHIHSAIQECNKFGHISLNKLQSLSSIPPGESLFYSLYVFENFPFHENYYETPVIAVKDLKAYQKTTYPLNIILIPEKELALQISYDGDCFTEDVIENLACHIESALKWIVHNSESPLKDINILSEREKHLLVKTFNDTYYDFPQDVTIHELIEKQAELHSDRIAVVYKDEKLSYRELNEKANKLAYFLRQEGVKPDSRVAIFLDRSCHMIVSILSVLKAGGAYVPIDPEYPVERIKYILSDSGSLMLITEPHLAEKINPSIKVLDITSPDVYTGSIENPEYINVSKNLAYIIYTSGSTGQPKGVMIEHRSLINMCLWHKDIHHLSEMDSMTKYASFGFDASVWEIFPALISGASLHVIPEDIRLSPSELNSYFEEHNITVSYLPTQFAEQFIEMFDTGTLRWLDTGGDKFRTFRKKNYNIVNNYGPTEYTVCTTSFIIDKYYENIPIGKPLYNTRVYILDKYNRLTPMCVPGELCICGDGMARGYLNRDELTAEKFVENPFEPGNRMYRTGDLARWLPDGNIEFLGRIDQQVKIRGFRIELGEIEEALKKIDSVKDAAVVDRSDKQGNRYLCACYISDIKFKSSELQKELSQFLPDYMVPSCFIKIDKIPVTAHGKLDRKSLPVPEESDMASHETYVAPRNEIEEILARIWKEVLSCDRVGIYDNFFSLGGDSIMSIQVVARAHKEGIHITASHLLRHPTIAAVSLIEKVPDTEKDRGEKEEIDRFAGVTRSFLETMRDLSSVEAIYELSPLQEGLLFHALAAPDSDNYCTQVSWSYEGEICIDALKQAWCDIFSLHAVFRTGFVWEESEKPYQIVYKNVSLPWNTVDLSEVDSSGQEKTIREILEKSRRSVSNLKTPPAGSLYLFILDRCKYRFLWTYHHIILDGWSMPLLLRELHRRYECIVNKEVFHSRAPVPYETYIKWLSLQNKEELINYWKKCLSDFSAPTPLSINKSRMDIHKSIENPGEYIYNLPASFLEECQQFARSSEVTVNALFQTAWSSVMSCYSGSDDILYGTTVSGRPPDLPGVEHMIGLFINTIPLRVRLNPDETVIYNLKNMHHSIQDGINFSHISLSKLQSLSGIPPGETLFYSLFVFENFPFSQEMLGMKDIKTYGKSTYPLNVVIVPKKDLSVNVSYDGDCFTDHAIKRLACHMEAALKWIISNPEGLLKDIDIVSDEEKNLLFKTFNDTYYEFPRDVTIHELIEKQADLHSDRTAVVYRDEKLSYSELNEKAGKLAHFLRREGVKPESRVVIFLEPSCDMIVSILAVLKAGGTYVPIDPHYPPERINYIISDSGAVILIAHSHLAEKIKPSIKVLNITDPFIYSGTGENLQPVNNSKDLAYIIYTSGSTGQPKGVMIEHHSLVNLSVWFKNTRGITEKDSVSKYVSFGFDASVPEIFPALISGGSIHIIPEELRLSPVKLNEYFEANNITVGIFPTQFGEQFMALTDNRTLRWLEVGGDRLKAFKKQNYEVVNAYGPTEYTVYTSSFIIDKLYENIPVGKPVYNTCIYILNKYGKITPVGIPGELCISGEGVARGYLNREELTKEKFVANPFEPGKRMYRTGDLARWLPDGNLQFFGRIDQQVKIRGFRIELGEIEEALKKIEAVKDAAVIDRSDKQGNKYLCGYYISDIKLKSSELQKELSRFLPDYMIPSCFLKIDKIPVTAHGKLDRKSLPEPEQNDLASQETYAAPRNEREEILAGLWKHILRCDRVGIYDNFFSLGGDSIISIQIAARAHNEGLHITASQILRNPTIASLSSVTEKILPERKGELLTGEVPLIPVEK